MIYSGDRGLSEKFESAIMEAAEVLVHSPEELGHACAHLTACGRFGLDTEFVGEDSYHPSLCLVQIATEDKLYLIDPFAAGPLDSLWNIIVDPACEVIVHAGREEVRLCHLWSGRTPGNLFDLQIAAGLVGCNYPLGHGALVAQLLGKNLSKGETLTEWRTRPLTPSQIRYAFDDVRYLLPLWERLSGQLRHPGPSRLGPRGVCPSVHPGHAHGSRPGSRHGALAKAARLRHPGPAAAGRAARAIQLA